jgi:hypothetical protein
MCVCVGGAPPAMWKSCGIEVQLNMAVVIRVENNGPKTHQPL